MQHNYHLVKPSEEQRTYCHNHNLVAFSEWIHIHQDDTYLHGPFNFATLNGRKTRDRVDRKDWEILSQLKEKYDNAPPSLTLSALTIHVDTNSHSEYSDDVVAKRVANALMSAHFGD